MRKLKRKLEEKSEGKSSPERISYLGMKVLKNAELLRNMIQKVEGAYFRAPEILILKFSDAESQNFTVGISLNPVTIFFK